MKKNSTHTPEAKAAMKATAAKRWTPEAKAAQGEKLKKAWAKRKATVLTSEDLVKFEEDYTRICFKIANGEELNDVDRKAMVSSKHIKAMFMAAVKASNSKGD